MECHCVSTEEPITCEETKPQTVTVISWWFHVATYCLLDNVYIKIKSKCSLFFFIFYELLMSHTMIGLPVISHISGRVPVIGSFQNQSVVVEIT